MRIDTRSAAKAAQRLMLAIALVGMGSVTGALGQDAQVPGAYKLPMPEISEELSLEGHDVEVNGTRIHWIEQGEGDPIVFIHGNPTSSYLWRNIMPSVSAQGRAVAVDLVGMGHSGKLKGGYGYDTHYSYLEGFISALDLKNITFVVHDWGAALGFDYASRHPDRVKRIAFMEGVLPPIFPQPSFEAMGEEMGGMFRALKDVVKGREMVVDNHMFVEQILPNFVNRSLGVAAMDEYRRPYANAEDREPLLAWPRDIPIAGEPVNVVRRMNAIKEFMTTTDMPILLLYADPGVLVSSQVVPWYVANVHNIETAFVGQGFHFVQEDNPVAIGRALADWIRRN